MLILVINTGSSSIKYSLIDMHSEDILSNGAVECIGLEDSKLIHCIGSEEKVKIEDKIENHAQAVEKIIEILTHPKHGIIKDMEKISAVGHRIGHGAEKLFESVEIDEKVMEILKENIGLAPIHMPHMVEGVKVFKKLLPDKVMVAVFDTAFHQTVPDKAFLYAIPYEYYTKYGIRRYGFHGPSHKYVSGKAASLIGKQHDKLKIVTCHLGNGASLAAVKNGKSVDTSMGFTPLAGVPMGTRCGDIDTSIIFYLMEKAGLSYNEIESILNKKSGFLGLTGASSDCRVVEQLASGGDERAIKALGVFCYSVKKYIGAYSAAMGGVDCIVFTGGIGENSITVRKNICEGLGFIGAKLSDEKNENSDKNSGADTIISTDDSKVKICLVHTNEELMIARETMEVLRKSESKTVYKQ